MWVRGAVYSGMMCARGAVYSGFFLGGWAQAVAGWARGAVYSGADFYTKIKSRLLTFQSFICPRPCIKQKAAAF